MQEAWSKVLACDVLQLMRFALAHFQNEQGTCLQQLAGAVIVL